MFFIDSLRGWASGDIVLKTTDGGANWTPDGQITVENLKAMYFHDLNSGWAVGARGTILKYSDSELNPPVLASPANSATNMTLVPTFSWARDSMAVYERIQISKFANFSTVAYSDTSIALSKKMPLASKLDTSTVYYWRARSYSAAGDSSIWSAGRSFTTQPRLMPPSLTSPANNAVSVPLSATFTWSSPLNAEKYIIQASTSVTFSNLAINDTVSSSNFTASNQLSPTTNYYWRVRSLNEGQVSDWSSAWIFTTAVQTGFTLSGSLKYSNAALTPMNNCTINIKNSSNVVVGTVVTDANGNYVINGLQNGTYSVEISTNKSPGGINTIDVLVLRQRIANVITYTPIQEKAGDVNMSNSINTIDVLVLRQKIANVPASGWIITDFVYSPTTITINNANALLNIESLSAGDVNASFTPAGN